MGARTLNESVIANLDKLKDAGVQVLWQCGKLYHEKLTNELKDTDLGSIKMVQFITRMDLAYAIADVVISRAGAISISELCLIAKPTILVPSPNVSEDHQTKNAMALVEKDAAVLVKDIEANETMIDEVLSMLSDSARCEILKKNIASLGKPDATMSIVDELEK